MFKVGENMIIPFGPKYQFCSSVLESLKMANSFTFKPHNCNSQIFLANNMCMGNGDATSLFI